MFSKSNATCFGYEGYKKQKHNYISHSCNVCPKQACTLGTIFFFFCKNSETNVIWKV